MLRKSIALCSHNYLSKNELFFARDFSLNKIFKLMIVELEAIDIATIFQVKIVYNYVRKQIK